MFRSGLSVSSVPKARLVVGAVPSPWTGAGTDEGAGAGVDEVVGDGVVVGLGAGTVDVDVDVVDDDDVEEVVEASGASALES